MYLCTIHYGTTPLQLEPVALRSYLKESRSNMNVKSSSSLTTWLVRKPVGVRMSNILNSESDNQTLYLQSDNLL